MSELIPLESHEAALERYQRELAERARSLHKQISAAPSNVIRTKQKQFRMPDDTVSPGPLRAVILDFAAFNSYFTGAYNPNVPQAPVCWAIGSLDSLAPSANGTNIQHDGDCAACPKNQWGSATNGGKGKACKNQMKLALIPADLKTADSSKIYTLNVSPTGIKLFSKFCRDVQRLMGDDALPVRVIAEIGFDPHEAYPMLTFNAVEGNQNMGVAMALMKDAQEALRREPSVRDAD